MIEAAVQRFISEDDSPEADAIRAKLAAYGDGLSLHTEDLPADVSFPAIVIKKVGTSPSGVDTRTQRGELANIDIQCFGNKLPSRRAISDWATAIWKFINRCDREIEPYLWDEGFEVWGVTADAPVNTQEGLGFPGYTIKARIRVLELTEE